MISRATVLPNSGYANYSKLETLENNTVPIHIMSKVYTFNDAEAERVLKTLEKLYGNPTIKPILDMLAVQIVKNDVQAKTIMQNIDELRNVSFLEKFADELDKRILSDDFYIFSGAELSAGNAHGMCMNREVEQELRIAFKQDSKSFFIINPLEDIGAGPHPQIISVDINSGMDDKDFQETLAHELSHAVANILFQNNTNGYNTEKQKAVFTQCLRSFAEKILYITDVTAPKDIHPSVDGTHLLRIAFNSLLYKQKGDTDKSSDSENSNPDFTKLLMHLLIQGYTADQVHSEMFVRLFEMNAMGSTALTGKFMKEFDPYFTVLNSAIDQYMQENKDYIPDFINKNEDGSYGVPKFWNSDPKYSFSNDEKLYFAIAAGKFDESKSLLQAGANPCSNDFVRSPLALAIVRNDLEALKCIHEHVKHIDLSVKDIYGISILEYLETDNEAAKLASDLYIKQHLIPSHTAEDYTGYDTALIDGNPGNPDLHTPPEVSDHIS